MPQSAILKECVCKTFLIAERKTNLDSVGAIGLSTIVSKTLYDTVQSGNTDFFITAVETDA